MGWPEFAKKLKNLGTNWSSSRRVLRSDPGVSGVDWQ